jgi:general secretion pathway protein G
MDNCKKGFTLVELVVVMSIISLLSSVVLANMNVYMAKARDARRKSDLEEMKKAIIIYYADHGSYPSTGLGWWGQCSTFGSHALSGSNGYIPNIAPAYMALLPVDPSGSNAGEYACPGYFGDSCYLYKSDGISYKLLAHCTPESYSPSDSFYDSVRPDWAYTLCSGDLKSQAYCGVDYNTDTSCPCEW